MSEREENGPVAWRWLRLFVIPWAAFLVTCGLLGLGGHRLGVAMALWDQPEGSGVIGVLWALPVAALVGLAWAPTKLMRKCLMILGSVSLLAASCAPESKFLLNPYADTCFDPGFDRDSFDRLHLGMSTTEVEAITGPPHFRRPPKTWGYLLPGNPDLEWIYSSDHCAWLGDYAWRSYRVGFREGSVVVISRAWRYD